jgi:hypothetical protein
MQKLKRFDLARRWNCSTRKVDRLRKEGLLAWVDLSQGRGGRPCVRFNIEDVEAFERQARLCLKRGSKEEVDQD